MSEPASEKKIKGRSHRKSTPIAPGSVGLLLEPHVAARQAKVRQGGPRCYESSLSSGWRFSIIISTFLRIL